MAKAQRDARFRGGYGIRPLAGFSRRSFLGLTAGAMLAPLALSIPAALEIRDGWVLRGDDLDRLQRR